MTLNQVEFLVLMIQSCSLWPPLNRLSEIEYCTSVPIPNVLCVCASIVCVDRLSNRNHSTVAYVDIQVHNGFDNQELIDNPGSLR